MYKRISVAVKMNTYKNCEISDIEKICKRPEAASDVISGVEIAGAPAAVAAFSYCSPYSFLQSR